MASPRKQIALVKQSETAALVREESDALARRALELRRKGLSYYEIAEKMGLPESQVAGLAHRAISSAADLVSQATRTELLAMELDRLDALQSAMWADAMQGDTQAVNQILKIIAMRMDAHQLTTHVTAATHQTVIITGDSPEYRAALERFQTGDVG